MKDAHSRKAPVWLAKDAGDFDTFLSLVEQTTNPQDYPLASTVASNVPIYLGSDVDAAAEDPEARAALMAEWARVFGSGPGIIAIKKGLSDTATIHAATAHFEAIIAHEKATGAGAGDHFAKPGANDRVWNALEKHCKTDPANFAAYYSAHTIAMAAEAWLGPNYQVTAQVNRVNPGGTAQRPHRDYHLGFMSVEDAARYPAQVHGLSPLLTLQGAVAHCDMPLESGPTLYLPYSQLFFEGYLAYNSDAYQDYFEKHHQQMALETGDVVFFNPAVMHGAGTNRSSDILRTANLLQIGSAFGRSIEAINRSAMVKTLYPALQQAGLPPQATANVIAASAEGYAYPTNLDTDLPSGGLAPKSQAQIFREALAEGLTPEAFCDQIDQQDARRVP